MPRKVNYPTAAEVQAEPGEIAQTVRQAMDIAKWPKIDKQDPEAVRKRAEEYFQYCIDTDRRPFVESLCLAIGCTRKSLIDWSNAGGERGEIATQCKQIIRSLLEQWSLTGRLNPPVAIFLMKNISGYSDNITIEAKTAETAPAASMTPEQIAAQIEEDIPLEIESDNVVMADIIDMG